MKVLIVKGTTFFDVYDLCEALDGLGVECVAARWNEIEGPPNRYDLAVLFGLSHNRDVADMYASAVRAAIGERTRLLIVSQWGRKDMAEPMKEKYGAEYQVRGQPTPNLLAVVLDMLEDAKTAP
jgi:hypothetical protein